MTQEHCIAIAMEFVNISEEEYIKPLDIYLL
jgi:hypothetical protein